MERQEDGKKEEDIIQKEAESGGEGKTALGLAQQTLVPGGPTYPLGTPQRALPQRYLAAKGG